MPFKAGNSGQSKRMPSPQKPCQFYARYLGSRTMDRLYSQTMQPWVMAEVRRRKAKGINVLIEIAKETLSVHSVSSESEESNSKVQFHHHLRGLTRFAKLHQDPCCFAYLTRYLPTADFECHVFLASAEEVVSKRIHNRRELPSQKCKAELVVVVAENLNERTCRKYFIDFKNVLFIRWSHTY